MKALTEWGANESTGPASNNCFGADSFSDFPETIYAIETPNISKTARMPNPFHAVFRKPRRLTAFPGVFSAFGGFVTGCVFFIVNARLFLIPEQGLRMLISEEPLFQLLTLKIKNRLSLFVIHSSFFILYIPGKCQGHILSPEKYPGNGKHYETNHQENENSLYKFGFREFVFYQVIFVES